MAHAPLPKTLSEDQASLIEDAIDARRFEVAYEPFVEPRTGARCAYEALARFFGHDGARLPTESVFAWLHEDPALLAEVECDLKAEQVARAPRAPLFVNLDPNGHAHAYDRGLPVLNALGGHPARVVVEVVESSRCIDADLIRRMIPEVKGAGLGVALDDLGAPHALVSLESLVHVDFFKFDRSVLRSVSDARYRALIHSVIDFARAIGARTVLEGIETRSDLAVAEAMGVDLVQGFLFRDAFVSAPR